jgi:hypothetical protein
MKIQQYIWQNNKDWFPSLNENNSLEKAQIVFIFGGREALENNNGIASLKENFPHATLIGCSTAGEIYKTNVYDQSIVATAIFLEKTQIIHHSVNIGEFGDSYEAGLKLIQKFDKEQLKHIFVLSDGLKVNGSELVAGMSNALPEHIHLTGGLAGDGANFKKTLVINQDGHPQEDIVVAIGFYGNNLEVSFGSFGGWDSFGIERLITKSKDNVLYELDNMPALELYKSFLGEKSKDLPASALLFPLSLRTEVGQPPVVRTILAINEEDQSMTFAGNLPQGSSVRLMKANMDRLIEGATIAAQCCNPSKVEDESLALLISCVGRKLVLKQLVEEEIDAVQEVLGQNTQITGFYSYGEICPFSSELLSCELHNQTMTITYFTEK